MTRALRFTPFQNPGGGGDPEEAPKSSALNIPQLIFEIVSYKKDFHIFTSTKAFPWSPYLRVGKVPGVPPPVAQSGNHEEGHVLERGIVQLLSPLPLSQSSSMP